MKTSVKKRPVGNIPATLIPKYFDDASLFHKDTLIDIIVNACLDVDSEYSRRVLNSLNYEDRDNLLDISVSPDDYDNAIDYYCDAQINGLIKKYPKWQTSYNPELQAKKTFIACELTCQETNRRFWMEKDSFPSTVQCILHIAQQKISNILREVPSIDQLEFKFGPGASYGVKYNTSALDKLASSVDATPSCYAVSDDFLKSCPGWRKSTNFDLVGPYQPLPVSVVKGDRLAFVPKTAKTHRPIGINPLLNGVIQKGYGAVIRDRLRPMLPLDSLQGTHRELARTASQNGSLATVDLKSASDTIAYALVQDLLPDPWFQALHAVRSPQYNVDDNWYTYQKFSAMGNGFTFELETLIFYALACATMEHAGLSDIDVSVYGDDVIIPTAQVPMFTKVLGTCGFSINEEKSFSEGPFRESCGGDYYNGVDVRPFFLKDEITYRTLFLMRNYLEKGGSRFIFKRLFRFLNRLLGKDVLSYYRGCNVLDDGSIYDSSMPLSSYNRIVPFEKGLSRSHKVKDFGPAFALYRNIYSSTQASAEPWHKTRIHRILFRPHRYVHI